MTKWLLGIVGVSFLAVLLDMVYPNGKTNAFCKSMFGVMAVYVMISPLLTIKKNNYKVDLIDNEVLETISNARNDNLKNQIENYLMRSGIEGVFIEIVGNMTENNYEIENIFIDISDLVLTENVTNINKYEVISQSVLEIIDIEDERIIFYG